jgi:hypothetical protein
MAQPKTKTPRREAGKSKFRLPERQPRVVETNPLREILQEAKAQEEANAAKAQSPTPAKEIAGVDRSSRPQIASKKVVSYTPASDIAGVSSNVADSPGAVPQAFRDFSKRWSPILRSGQMSVCRVLFEMTHSIGQTECFTSMPKLAAAAGLKERQCYNVVGQLEQLGFIDRPEIYNTPTKKGTVFRLYLSPQINSSGAGRQYHIGGEGSE